MKEWWDGLGRGAKIAAVVIGVLILGVIASGGEDGAEPGDDVTAANTTTVTGEAPTTTVAETTTSTTATTTTTTVATTTTEALSFTAGEVKSFMPTVFEDSRDTILDTFSDDINVQSVDRYDYDSDAETVILDVTSNWASPSNQVDGAWEITRSMAVLWEPPEDPGDKALFNLTPWIEGEPWVPGFRLVNSGSVYECSGDFMVQLADVRAGRGDWEANCG